MSYIDWKVRHAILATLPWYDVEQLLEVLITIRSKNFSVQEARNQGLADINSIRVLAPFGQYQRFPDNAMYVTEAYGDWAHQFAQLKSACSYKNRAAEVRGHVPDADERRAENDAQQAFWNATTKMLEELNRANTLIDRVSFEHRERLNWQDPVNP